MLCGQRGHRIRNNVPFSDPLRLAILPPACSMSRLAAASRMDGLTPSIEAKGLKRRSRSRLDNTRCGFVMQISARSRLLRALIETVDEGAEDIARSNRAASASCKRD